MAVSKSFIIQKARELGFQKTGFAAPEPLRDESANLRQWLGADRHGSMAWLEQRQKERTDITAYWPEVKTVVVLAMNYYAQPPAQPADAPRFSNYAWGDDYHKLIKKRLKALLAAIQAEDPAVNGIVCVDTSPVMEKVWAQRAGLGWQGKHTNLITRDYGSWVFLGELLLDVALEPDSPFDEDLCGSCTACLEACPTGALDAPYQLDARKCISYLTIEHREEFTREQRDMLHGWIYGCDICQKVCPWNIRFGRETEEPAFQPRTFMDWTLADWLGLDEVTWDSHFTNSAARRTGYEGLMRNLRAV